MKNEDIQKSAFTSNEKEIDFAEMLEKSYSFGGRLRPGQKVIAKVVGITSDLVYIDIGGKSEGTINLNEFMDVDGRLTVKYGDSIEAFFVTSENGTKKLTTLINGYSATSLNAIKSAYESGMPVSGTVKREIRGGFEILTGEVRCFCPFSQIDLKSGREGGLYLGQTFSFKILEFKENGKNIIVSRKALLEEERQEKINRLKETLTIGYEIECTVKSIQNFGVFVDLGGIDGFIPLNEISWDRTVEASEIIAIGQTLKARIISIDWEKNRIALSIKAMQPDPWATVAERYPVDTSISGKIVRLTNFGAFVNIEPGVDGLVHISNLGAGRRINHPKEFVTVGQQVEAYVVAVDTENRRLSLSMKPKIEPRKIVYPEVGDPVDGVVDKVLPFGIILKLNNCLSGLVPKQELGIQAGTDLKRMFPAGTEMKVVVIDVDTQNKKIRLSRKAALEKTAQDEYREYIESTIKTNTSSNCLGSLGDLFREKLINQNR